MKKDQKIVRYRKRFHLNIGVIVFAFVLIYFLIYLVSYLTANHIAVYEVQKGAITRNTIYTGIALRTEEICTAEETGAVNYYKKEADKVGVNDLVCSVDQNGSISEKITEAGLDGTQLSDEDLKEVRSYISDYMSSYSNMQFYNTYTFKDGINAKIQEDLYTRALEELSEQTDAAVSQHTFSLVKSQKDGILAFYTDGYEDVTPQNFTADRFDPSAYKKNNLKANTSVSSGQPLYKLVPEEDWYMLIPITESEKKQYQQEIPEDAETFVIHVTFKKDETDTYATASIEEYDGKSFLKLAFNNSMIRFLSDRYLEVELGSADMTGLKIPNSSITEKEFLLIPKNYVGKGGDSSKNGVLKVSREKNGREIVEFIPTELYRETDDYYYIANEQLAAGDTIQMPDSSETYTIRETEKLKGVYNINRGYAVFRLIDILMQNEEYTIVASGSDYGIALYDRLALDGNSVTEGEMAN